MSLKVSLFHLCRVNLYNMTLRRYYIFPMRSKSDKLTGRRDLYILNAEVIVQ